MIKINCDKSTLNIDFICKVLSVSYWARNRNLEQIKTSINNSLCFGMYLNNQQIGFARIVTDKVIFSYLMDVIIDEKHQGKGLGKQLMTYIYNHGDLQNVKNHYLHTKDAQPFYQLFGFEEYQFPDRFMLRR